MGMTVQVRAMMYKIVAQTVFIYGSYTWVVMDAVLKVLEGLHHIFSQRIAGTKSRQVREGGWEW